MGATEEVEVIRCNTVIRSGEERGTNHDDDDGGGGGSGSQRPLARNWAKHWIGIISSDLHLPTR